MKHFSSALLTCSLLLSASAGFAQKRSGTQPTSPVKSATKKVAVTSQLARPGFISISASAASRSDYTFLVDSLLVNVDVNNVPHGILYDRVVANAALHAFGPKDKTTAGHLLQAYHELYNASYDQQTMPYTRTGLRAAAEAEIRSGIYSIGTLDYNFSVIDTLAEDRGYIKESDGHYHLTGEGEPFESRHITLAAIMADTVPQSFQLGLSDQLQVGNTRRQVSYVEVNSAGLNTRIPLNQPQYVTFQAEGWQTLEMHIYFTDGSKEYRQSEVYVRGGTYRPQAAVVMPLPLVQGRIWTDYTGTAGLGHGEVEAHLLHPLSKSDNRLRNVVVVIDGFDPTDTRRIPAIARQFGPLLSVLENTSGKQRDVVFLNFPTDARLQNFNGRTQVTEVRGGADYIERNALVLVELLNRLKPMLANPNEKITILGPSMGGLISRYALALMEKNYADAGNSQTFQQPYWQHNVDTWISSDTPHQGANIPFGVQQFLNYFQGVSEAAEHNLGRLNSVAARQMLIHHTLNMELNASDYHAIFTRNLNNNGLPGSMGYPTQVRRVGIANGLTNGIINSSLGSYGQTGVQLDVVHSGNYKNRRFFYRSTANGTQIAANMYFSGPAGQTTTVFDGEARVIVSLARPVSKRTQVRLRSDANGSYDLAPGGTFNSQFEIMDKTLNGKQLPGYEYRFSNVRPDHSFIPTVSALAFQYRTLTNYQGRQQLPNPYTDMRNRSLICNDETPFDVIYAPFSNNTAHVSLDAGSQQFLVRELFNIAQPPTFDATAGNVVCANGNLTLNLKDCSPRSAVTYNWSISGPAVFVSTGTTTAANGGGSQQIRSTGATGNIVVSVTAGRVGATTSPAATYQLSVSGTPYLAIDQDHLGKIGGLCVGDPVELRVWGVPGPYSTLR